MEISLCNSEKSDKLALRCSFDLLLLISSSMVLLLNLWAVVRMCCFTKRVKFENLVILAGILQSILIIFISISNFEVFVLMIVFIQVMIYLYIIRRFIRIFYNLKRKEQNEEKNEENIAQSRKKRHYTQFYNLFFYINSLINFVFLLAFMFFTVYEKEEDELDSYLQIAHSIFSLYVCITLFVIGSKINKMIDKSLNEDDVGDFKQYYREGLIQGGFQGVAGITGATGSVGSNEKLHTETILVNNSHPISKRSETKQKNETYYNTRKLQINLIIYISVISEIFQLFYLISKTFIYPNEFQNKEFQTYAVTEMAIVTHGVNLFFNVLQIFFNYVAFYFVIRNSYKVKLIKDNDSNKDDMRFSNETFQRLSNVQSNQEIDNFLKKTMVDNQRRVTYSSMLNS